MSSSDFTSMPTAALFAFAGTNMQSLPYPVGTMGTIRYVGDHGGGVVRMSIDGTDPSTENYAEFNAQHTLNLHGVDLGLVRLNGSATTSDYSIAVEVWT